LNYRIEEIVIYLCVIFLAILHSPFTHTPCAYNEWGPIPGSEYNLELEGLCSNVTWDALPIWLLWEPQLESILFICVSTPSWLLNPCQKYCEGNHNSSDLDLKFRKPSVWVHVICLRLLSVKPLLRHEREIIDSFITHLFFFLHIDICNFHPTHHLDLLVNCISCITY